MSDSEKLNKYQNMIFIILWGSILTLPILLSFNDNPPDYIKLFHEIERIFPFFILFLVNNFITYKLFLKKKYLNYILISSAIIISVCLFSHYQNYFFELLNIPQAPPLRIELIGVPTGDDIFKDGFAPPPMQDRMPPGDRTMFNPFMEFSLRILFCLLVVGMNNSIRMAFSWMKSKNDYETLQKENYKTELAYLQQQINPHFFMNTLNNIHSMIEFDKEKAKGSVIKLSKLMRVLLYEKETDLHSIDKEIRFIKDYIDLMKIRLKENTDIKFEYPEERTDIKIEPFLFLNFIENAFKHGIKAIDNSFIHVRFSLSDGYLLFEVKNSKKEYSGEKDEDCSVGLVNSIKRLDLLYNNTYSFEKNENDTEFSIRIKIPVRK